jgi:hypothetical protein
MVLANPKHIGCGTYRPYQLTPALASKHSTLSRASCSIMAALQRHPFLTHHPHEKTNPAFLAVAQHSFSFVLLPWTHLT